ncbi:hypothetical protein F1188_12755 [Roseospira marina]|uniref:Uncharacterized protein n=1 Tax=Roseospira marina TaxID=140057 RepID=A0A5M6IAB4_9PROT|nr:hypothetical protein [Roseospira marina]KAA5605143.1 hypothetical protein F1188_12755 [Roseospira marina]MBB4314898.1 hypothetical protein [Roseospira marina]MBB5087898.1 hypothetical protein [Roseospira marina]
MDPLEWPENDAATAERDRFDACVMVLLGEAAPDGGYVVFVPFPGPAPSDPDWERVPADGGLDVVPMARRGVAWVCPLRQAAAALRPVFVARTEQLSILSFRSRPTAAAIDAALRSEDGRPADRLLFFDDGELMEVRSGCPEG